MDKGIDYGAMVAVAAMGGMRSVYQTSITIEQVRSIVAAELALAHLISHDEGQYSCEDYDRLEADRAAAWALIGAKP